MKKYYILLTGAILTATMELHAQTKIGGSGAPDSSAMLEVTGGVGNNKGILLPRISLVHVDTWGLSGGTPVAGMYVYNTNAGIFGGDGAGPYYWNGTKWVKALDVFGWRINGNSGTDSAYHFIGTTDAKPLIMRTSNGERMRISSTGNVGIGTSTPLSPLSFANAVVGTKISLYDNSSATEHYGFGVSGGQLNYQVMGAGTHSFRAGGKNEDGTELMRIQGTGSVGIGNSNPLAPLSFANTTAPKISLYDNNSTTEHYGLGVGGGQLNYQVMTGGSHVFRVGGKNGDGTELMRIQGLDGNVGIGTSSPTATLDVNGTARIAGNAGSPASLIMGRDANGYISSIALGANLSLAGGVLSASGGGGGTTDWALGGNAGTDPTINYVGTNDAQPLIFRTNGAEHLRITTDGKIGIDNAAPIASLDINGSARITTSLGTATAITGRDANGYLSNITLGANLSLAGGVLSATGGGTADWGLTGNAGTNPAINFIGTTDAQPLWFRTNNSNKMVLTTDGHLGFNTANPIARIDMVSNGADDGDDILVHRYADINSSGVPRLSFVSQGGTEAAPTNITNLRVLNAITMKGRIGGNIELLNSIRSIYTGDGTTQLSEFRFLTSGLLGMMITDQQFVGIGNITPTQRLQVDGNVLAVSYLTSSDRRLKTNISDMQNGLSTVMALHPVTYDKKKSISDNKYDHREIGFIAQEIQKVLPSVVIENKDADKTLAVSYTELIPVLTKAIQELNTQVETLKAENQELKESKVATAQLMERVKQMEQMMGINEIEAGAKVAGK